MPFIKPRARGKYLHKVVALLDKQNHDTLHTYARFIDESTDYVLNELIDAVLARNKRFREWRQQHAGTAVGEAAARRPSDATKTRRTRVSELSMSQGSTT